MKYKRICIYASIAVWIAVICGTWLYFARELIDKTSFEAVLGKMRYARSEVMRTIDGSISSLRMLAVSPRFSGAGDMGSVLSVIPVIEELHSDYTFAVMDGEGRMFEKDGAEYSVVGSGFKEAMNRGYGVISIYDEAYGIKRVAFIARTSAAFESYLAVIDTKKRFADKIAAFFDSWNGRTAVFDELSDIVASNPSLDTLEEDDGGEVEGVLLSGLSEFSRTGSEESAETLSEGTRYRAYIRLEEPRGWRIGSYFSKSPLWEGADSLRKSSALLILSIGVLFSVLIAFSKAAWARLEAEYRRAVLFDPLTGLGNSVGMEPLAEEFLEGRNKEDYSVICIDIEAFDRFNSMFGYQAGDKLLTAVAGAIKKRCEYGVRVNKDVFITMAETSRALAGEFRESLYDAISKVFAPEYLKMLSFNFGICRIKENSGIFRNIFDEAMLAVKEAKSLPAGGNVVYDHDLEQSKAWKLQIERSMLNAIQNDEFQLYIQPKWNLIKNACSGGEALIRWQSPEFGFLAPDRFIPIFEENNFIIEIDFFMIQRVISMIERELERKIKPKPIAVNVSKTTMMFPNYTDRLSDMIRRTSVPASLLELEVTESALSGLDYANIRRIMCEMKNMGFTLTMDDFGSGYSSFNTLRELPVDVLKIDKVFLDAAPESARSQSIIRSIVEMAKDIGIKVVCEGVETDVQVEFLKSIGCDYAQGYFFSRPVGHLEYEEKYVYVN
ncbi:MAG: bifunctional diguanylate cyclase/phosphodiesterase [Synergistaceae bacterium]|jgi:diguanylate cyclase (GGDEF)-like protein|nr:bifunctional diguanylate cyclase/phosphodiesterase [Synergistaceae bacterium]